MRVALILAIVAGCSAMPEERAERALYDDLRRLVETEQRTTWMIDRYEIEQLMAPALVSVCQVEPARRTALKAWLQDRIAQDGGPARARYEADPDADLDEVLALERVALLLDSATAVTAKDCPFWLEPDPEFSGLQGSRRRLVILGESQGGLAGYLRDEKFTIGGAGSGRLLLGYGFEDVTLALGAEVGGNGEFNVESSEITAGIAAAVPILLRFHDHTWSYDVELAGLSHWRDGALTWPPGFRLGGRVSVSGVRIGSFLPYLGGWIGYEFLPAHGDVPVVHTIKIGTIVGFDWDP